MELARCPDGEVGGRGGRGGRGGLELGRRLLGLRQRIWVGARGQCLEGVEELQGSYAVGPPMGGVQDDLLCMRNYAAMKGQGWMPAIRSPNVTEAVVVDSSRMGQRLFSPVV
ncbi:hypothetical protein VSDG_09250 [Cytospora chrysosperma]|uniref:Uncharacterized protein n=1 Tax=Cytospora chrysosperma TaxID=252740 RepID=A0A423VBV7_CYTCH|nr:hypothetical protein VSDG_09250 [Valsa sordida]